MGTDELSIWLTDGLGKEFRRCFIIITSFNLFKFEGNAKIVNTALKAKAKAKATGPEAKAKVKAIKFGLEAKAWPRGLHHCL